MKRDMHVWCSLAVASLVAGCGSEPLDADAIAEFEAAEAAEFEAGVVDEGSAASPDGELGTIEQGWSTRCTGSTPSYVAHGSFAECHVSPSYYNSCYKSYIVELLDPENGANYFSAEFPEPATTREECEKRFLGVIYHTRADALGQGGVHWDTDWRFPQRVKVFGTWASSWGECIDPWVVLETSDSYAGYRYTLTARTRDSSSAPVVPVAMCEGPDYAFGDGPEG